MSWISVKDRLPKDRQLVLAYRPRSNQYDVEWAAVEFQHGESEADADLWVMELPHEMLIIDAPTHWMPLPPPPEAA